MIKRWFAAIVAFFQNFFVFSRTPDGWRLNVGGEAIKLSWTRDRAPYEDDYDDGDECDCVEDIPMQVKRVPNASDIDGLLPLPAYATPGSAGIDLRAAEAFIVKPGERFKCPTGLAFALPEGTFGAVLPRSGISLNDGLLVVTGTVDDDYRGEIGVILANISGQTLEYKRGAKIAQFVVVPTVRVALEEVTELAATERGAGGFGSTGV